MKKIYVFIILLFVFTTCNNMLNDARHEMQTNLYTDTRWTRLLGAPGAETWGGGLSVDSSGNSYLAGCTFGNFDGHTKIGIRDGFVGKYNSSGEKQWTRIIGVAGNYTYAYRISVDSSGNSYVAGQTDGNLDGETITGLNDAFVIKYDTSGNRQWTKLFGTATLGKGTAALDIFVDPSGNSYVTGYTNGDLDGETLTGTEDVFVVKLDSSGVKKWTRILGATGAITRGNAISIDSSGNSYVAGQTDGNLDGKTKTGTQDVFVIKYDTLGNKHWTRLLGAAGANTVGYGIAVDSAGNSYVAGQTNGNLDGQTLTGVQDAFIVMYDTPGGKRWTKLFGAAGTNTVGYGIYVDSNGNCYVTGGTLGNLDGQTLTGTGDVFVSMYNSAAARQWTKLLGVAGGNTYGVRISFDSSGNSYVSGSTNGNLDGQTLTGIDDVFITTKLNP